MEYRHEILCSVKQFRLLNFILTRTEKMSGQKRQIKGVGEGLGGQQGMTVYTALSEVQNGWLFPCKDFPSKC